MDDNYFSSSLINNRIEIFSSLFSSANIINADFHLRIEIDGHYDRYFNYYDFAGISNYLFASLPKIKKTKNSSKNTNTQRKNNFLKIDNLHSNWLSLIDKVDKEVLAVHKKNLHSTGFKKYQNFSDIPEVKLIFIPNFYDYKYLVADAKNYRAANIAFNNIDYLIHQKLHLDSYFVLAQEFFNSLFLKELGEKKPEKHHFEQEKKKNSQINNNLFSIIDYHNCYNIKKILMEAHSWMNLFSDTGKTYRALNKTLMNLPPQIPELIVCSLHKIHIHKPLTDRLEFLAYLLSENIFHQNIFRNSRSEQIKKAFKIYCDYTIQDVTYSTRKFNDFIIFLKDYRNEFHGNIIDLTKRSIKWHNEFGFWDFEIISQNEHNIDLNQETAKPPIPLPVNNHIRFLNTSGDILEEGRIMKHCVATYIDLAVAGKTYLFHIDYNGEQATAEIDRVGNIRQIKGVENRHNSACDYGMLVLGEWSRQLINYNNTLLNTFRVDYVSPF